MRIFLLAALMPLTACASLPVHIPDSPAAIKTNTPIDATALQAGIAANNGYIAASKAGVLLVQFGKLDKAKFKALDNRGYAAVMLLHDARVTRDATNYFTALVRLNKVLEDFATLLGN